MLSKGDLTDSANNIIETGIYSVRNNDESLDLPFVYGILICIQTRGYYNTLQIAIENGIARIHYRIKVDDWSKWYSLT